LSGGTIWYRERQLTGLGPDAIARLGMGRTFQEPRVFGEMTVLDNVLVGCARQTGEGLLAALVRPPKVAAEEGANREQAEQLLAFVDLADRRHDLAGELAYGQQRFLSIARALAADPEVLLLDEPTVGLHPEEVGRLTGLVQTLVRERDRTVLLVEHNMDVVMSLSDWIVLLVEGQVVASEPPATIKSNPKLIEAYLGTSYQPSAISYQEPRLMADR